MTFNNKRRETIRGLMMGCFLINLFMFLLVLEAWGGGIVPDYLPWMLVGNCVLCLFGYQSNKPLPTEDDDES
jgi:hypothetical protein